VKPALQPVVGMSDSLTLETSTYDWALRLPYEILKPIITPLLVNFEFYLHLVKVLLNTITADLSSGMKVYSKKLLVTLFLHINESVISKRHHVLVRVTCTCNVCGLLEMNMRFTTAFCT